MINCVHTVVNIKRDGMVFIQPKEIKDLKLFLEIIRGEKKNTPPPKSRILNRNYYKEGEGGDQDEA